MIDSNLINKCISGDRQAQESLYKYYAPKLKGICMRYARSLFEGEDIFQEAFIKVFNNLSSFNYKGSFDGWVRRIVINCAIDHYKKNLVFKNQFPYEDVNESEIDFVEIADQLSVEELYEIINKLPEGYKLVFNLFAIDGYSHKEIAELLNISEGTSKSQLAKARRHIKDLLTKYNFVLK